MIKEFRDVRQHSMRRFHPPFARCKCGLWRVVAPRDWILPQQREWLIERFRMHKGLVRACMNYYRAQRRQGLAA